MARKRDSRAELVQTMARLLREQGYTATSRAQLLAKSGVSNGSLYHHFPGGMEALAEAALEASGAVHPTQARASSASSTSRGGPGKSVPAARSRRPHSNHPSSAPVYAPSRRGASMNRKL